MDLQRRIRTAGPDLRAELEEELALRERALRHCLERLADAESFYVEQRNACKQRIR